MKNSAFQNKYLVQLGLQIIRSADMKVRVRGLPVLNVFYDVISRIFIDSMSPHAGSIVDNIFLYYIVFGIDKLGMLNAASGIILVSIGVDDVLVFINIFRSKSRQMNTREKVASTLHGAAISTFLTSFTTSLAFSGNQFTENNNESFKFLGVEKNSDFLGTRVFFIPTFH